MSGPLETTGKFLAAKVGAPSLYTTELADQICELVATIPRGLDYICASEMSLPSPRAVHSWLEKHPEFAQKYTRARERLADGEFDRAAAIADDATPENVQVARLQVDTIKWRASKLAPKKYGDLRRVEMSGIDGAPIQTEHREVVDLSELNYEQREALRAILESARADKALNVSKKE